MESIPVKINQAGNGSKTPPDGTPPPPPNGRFRKTAGRPQKISWPVWFLTAALIIAGACLAYLLLTKKENIFAGFIPPETAAIVYFSPQSLQDDAQILQKGGYAWPPFLWAGQTVKNFINGNDLGWLGENIGQALADQAVFAWLNNGGNPPQWILLARLKISPDIYSAQQNRLENSLKLKYNLITELYRQTKITRVKHLDGNPNDVYYASLKNYLLISDNPDLLKSTIDRIMD